MYLHPTLGNTDLTLPHLDLELSPTPVQLADIADHVADAAGRWRSIPRHDPFQRRYTRLLGTDRVEVWLLGWTPGQQVPAHDHGGAAGAFTVVDGPWSKTNSTPTPGPAGGGPPFRPARGPTLAPTTPHILGNRGIQPATSVHAFSPHQAATVAASGGLLVDIRPAAQRAEEGEIPGAIIIERNVLEWRLDPASPHRIPEVQGHDQPIVILCSEGYTSSLTAAVLQDLACTRRPT